MRAEERDRLERALLALLDGDNYEADRMLLKAVTVVREWPVDNYEAVSPGARRGSAAS